MTTAVQIGDATLVLGDACAAMAALAENSVDTVLTDPPYGLEFMGRDWDRLARPKVGNLGGFADGAKPSFARVAHAVRAEAEAAPLFAQASGVDGAADAGES